MHPHQPPTPPPPPPQPPPLKQTRLSPLYQIVLSKQAQNLKTYNKLKSKEQPIIRHHPRRTKPIVWCGAILCSIFSLLLIFFSIAILILFLVVKPQTPVFDTPAASLSVIYINSPQFLRSEITFLANFSNPNRKLSVRFEHVYFGFYFSDSRIATQAIEPFSQKRGEIRVMSVRLVSNLVILPPNLVVELQTQEKMNRVIYNIKGSFRVRVKLGVIHYSYWLHSTCQIEMTSPPVSVLIAHQCRTTR